jgi:hypothetical protein
LLIEGLLEKFIHFLLTLGLFLFFLLLELRILEVLAVDEANKDEEGAIEDEDLGHQPEIALGRSNGARFGDLCIGIVGVWRRVHSFEVYCLAVEQHGDLQNAVHSQSERGTEVAFHTGEKQESNTGINNVINHNEPKCSLNTQTIILLVFVDHVCPYGQTKESERCHQSHSLPHEFVVLDKVSVLIVALLVVFMLMVVLQIVTLTFL